MKKGSFGKNLMVLMAKRDIRTLKELEEITGVSRVTLSKIKNDRVESISLKTIVRICHALDCEVNELLNIENVS